MKWTKKTLWRLWEWFHSTRVTISPKVSPRWFLKSLIFSENAYNIANYCHSYRQCLLMLQLWSCAYPAPNSSPVNDLCGIQKDEENDSFTSLALYNRGNREKLAPFYHSGVRFIAVNRWKLLDAGARMSELNRCSSPVEDDEDIYKLRRLTSGKTTQNQNFTINSSYESARQKIL